MIVTEACKPPLDDAGARAGRAFLCRPLCDHPREAAPPISRASCASAAGTGPSDAAGRRAGRADGGARLCRRPRLRRGPRRRACPSRLWRAAGRRGAARRRHRARRMRPRRAEIAADGAWEAALRFAERRQDRAVRGRASPIARPAKRRFAAMLRAGHPARSRAPHRRRRTGRNPGSGQRAEHIWFTNMRNHDSFTA